LARSGDLEAAGPLFDEVLAHELPEVGLQREVLVAAVEFLEMGGVWRLSM